MIDSQFLRMSVRPWLHIYVMGGHRVLCGVYLFAPGHLAEAFRVPLLLTILFAGLSSVHILIQSAKAHISATSPTGLDGR